MKKVPNNRRLLFRPTRTGRGGGGGGGVLDNKAISCNFDVLLHFHVLVGNQF